MSESKNIHWVKDEDLLERFVLGRLAEAETAALEKHLRECDQCQEIVTNERELVAGIRLAGRESVKRRLAESLEQRKAQRPNWYRVAGVAAGIVLLVTVGVYNRWFAGADTQREKQDRADRTEMNTEATPPVSPQRQMANAEKPASDAVGRTMDEENRKAPKLTAEAPRGTAGGSGSIAGAPVDKLTDLKAREAGRENEVREKKERMIAATAVSGVSTTWVQGTVLSERDQNAPAPTEMAAVAKDDQAILSKGKQEPRSAVKTAKARERENTLQNYTITQRRLSELPPTQRAQQQKTSNVQMLLQKDQGATRIIVYLDSLLTKEEFDQTRVQNIGEDSIILNLGNRRVGYKLPPEWTGQGARQIKKEK